MSVEALTLEESFAVITKSPRDEGTVLRMAQFTQVSAGMTGDFIEHFFACMAILLTRRKRYHTSVDIIVIVMVVKVKTFLVFGTRINERIQIFFGHDVELISRKGSLEFRDLANATWTKGNTRRFMEFLSK